MQVILLDKVANLGSLGDQVNVKAGYARNFLVPQGKAVPATKKNVEFSKHVVLNWKPNWLTFWRLLTLALKQSTHWAPLLSRLKLATKVNCSVPSVLAISLMQSLQQALKWLRAKFACRTAFCVPLVSTKLTSRFTAKCSLNWLLT